MTIACGANVSLNFDLGDGNDSLILGYDPSTGQPVPEALGVAVSDGPGPDYVGSYMQLTRFGFGPGGVVSDPGLFDSAPLTIDDGAGADLYELVTYPDPQDPGQQTHGSQRIDVSYASRPATGSPGQGPQLLVRVPGAPPTLADPVTTTQFNGTYKNFQTVENDTFGGVFSVTGTQGGDLMYPDTGGTYPAEMHGAGGDDTFIDFSTFLRAYGDDGDDTFEAGYPDGSAPAPWLNQDHFEGGPDDDTATYQGINGTGVRIDPGTDDNGTPTESNYLGTDVENLYGTSGEDQIVGTDAANQIEPFEGSDAIDAGNGDDTIHADDSRLYRDTIACGAGDDYVSFDYRALSSTDRAPLDSMDGCEAQDPAVDDNGDGCSSLDEGTVYFADPFVLDSDDDGRNNCEEIDGIDGRPPTNPIVADTDSDVVLDGPDNCPVTYNPDQADGDGDGLGDACEAPVQPNAPSSSEVSDVKPVSVQQISYTDAPPANGICALQWLRILAPPEGGLEVHMLAKRARLVKVFVVKSGVSRHRWQRFRKRVERDRPTTRFVGERALSRLGMLPGHTYRLRARVINEAPACQALYKSHFPLRVTVPKVGRRS